MSDAKIYTEIRKTVPWKLIVIFALFSAAIVVAGIFYYRSQKRRIISEETINLAAIASLKISQIESWRKERLGDAVVIKENRPLIKTVRQFYSANDKGLGKELTDWMKSIVNGYDYESALIADTSLRVRLSVNSSDIVLGDSLKREMKSALSDHNIVLTDLHRSTEVPDIHLDILIPLFDSVDKKYIPVGMIVLGIDPNKVLFPLINSWPTASKSSETLLLRKERDSILYLNELRLTENTALRLRLPISNKDLLATKAANGLIGTAEGVDYRNVPVVGSLHKVSGTQWFMVAKVDKAEILAPLKRYVVFIIIVVVLLILINASIFGFWIWDQNRNSNQNQLRHARAMLESQEKLRETNEYLSNLFNYANAPIIVWDTSLLITRFNHAFENLSGYSADEVIGRKISVLFPKDESRSSLSLINDAVKGERWETVEIEIQRKDGKKRIVLWNSANIHEKDGITVMATIAQGHDITVRKQAENSLKESEILLQSIIDNSNSLIYIVDAEGKFIHVNQLLLKLLSTTQSQLIGQSREVFLPKEIADIHRKNDLEVIKSKKTQIFEEENIEPDGKHYYLTTKFPLYNNQHEIYAVGGLSTDITERKIAEEAVHESENKLREAQEMAHLGFWKWDIKSGDVEWSEEVYKIFHLDPNNFKPQIDSILALSPWEEDNNRNTELINRAIKSHESGNYEQKFLRPDKSIGYYYSTFQGKYGENGDLTSIVGTVLDITERKLTESALLDSEERFRTLYENATFGIYRTTADGKILMANPALVHMLGFKSFEELAKRNLEKEGYEPDYPRTKFIKTLEKQGRIIGLESAWHKRDGSTLYVRESAISVRDDKGKILYYDGNVEDITERKKIEEALRESEDKFKYIFDHSVIGKSITFPTGEIHVNKALCDLLGYSEKELESKKWQDISHPEDIEQTQKIMDSLISGEKRSARFLKRYIHKNGAVVWTDVGTALRRDENGKPLYFMTAIIDITERKKAEESLHLKNFVFDDSIAANSISDLNGILKEVNAAFVRIWGYQSKDEVIGKSLAGFIKESSDANTIITALNSNSEWEGDYPAIRKNGSTFIAHGLATVVKDESGKAIGYQSAVIDVTDAKKAEELIHRLNEELEQKVIQRTELLEAANKELEAFSYSVSHDLRAPLRSVHGYSKILLEEYENTLDEEGKRICGIISSSATQMGELIDDLLSFSRIGRSSIIPMELDMKSMVISVFAEISSAVEKSRTKLKIGKLHKAFGDAKLIKLVWNNLISNAIKYSAKKKISDISVSSQLKYNRITYSVKDNGVGFDMNYKHKLFSVFQRLHTETEFEGNGVGLAIVQRIILKHGGKVWAEGEVGTGATFYFSLPVSGDRQQATGDRQTKNQTPVA
jgi:PAS domain S-box-containing protein